MSMRAAAAVLVLLVALAGCSGGPAPPPADDAGDDTRVSDGRTSAEGEHDASSDACIGLNAFFVLPQDAVQQQLPAGYTARSYAGPMGHADVVAVRCESLTIGNVTVKDVGLAWAEGGVEPAFDNYRWHFVVDEDPAGGTPLTRLLESSGWPVQRGTVQVDATGFSWQAGDLAVAATVPTLQPTGPAFLPTTRGIHAVDAAGLAHSFTESFDSGASVLAFSGATLQANQGPLRALAPEGAPLVGVGNALNSPWTLTLVR